MPGIVLGQSSSKTNPLLPFFYQLEGLLKPVEVLTYEIYKAGSATLIDSGSIDPVADEIGTGYWAAPCDPEDLEMAPGAYEIVFSYTVTVGGATTAVAYPFEVLDPKYFRISQQYNSYVASNVDILDEFELHVRQRMLNDMSREVDRLTERFFFPRYIDILHTVRPDSMSIWLDQPIIGINKIVLESAGVITGVLIPYDLDLASIRIYNRHLSYLLSPDDRDNPKIVFALVGQPAHAIEPSRFPTGVKNIRITGVFGYTDPDGGPFGETPRDLQDVVTTLAYRKLKDPMGDDPFTSSPGRVKSARTRDQSITFESNAAAKTGTYYMTGDLRLDSILAKYCRPFHVGVAGG